jgi:hypothetical protein
MPTTGFGSSDYLTPGEAFSVFGRVQCGAPFSVAPSTTFNHMAGAVGEFAVIGTYANFGLMAGVLGTINTNTLSGDAAVMAFMDGDAGLTTCSLQRLVLRWLKPQLVLVLSMVLT